MSVRLSVGRVFLGAALGVFVFAGAQIGVPKLQAQLGAAQGPIDASQLKERDQELLERLQNMSGYICGSQTVPAAYHLYVINDPVVPSLGALLCSCPLITSQGPPMTFESPGDEISEGLCCSRGVESLFAKAKAEVDIAMQHYGTSGQALLDSLAKNDEFPNYAEAKRYSEMFEKLERDEITLQDFEAYQREFVCTPEESYQEQCQSCSFNNDLIAVTPSVSCCTPDSAASCGTMSLTECTDRGGTPHVDQTTCEARCGKGTIEKKVSGNGWFTGEDGKPHIIYDLDADLLSEGSYTIRDSMYGFTYAKSLGVNAGDCKDVTSDGGDTTVECTFAMNQPGKRSYALEFVLKPDNTLNRFFDEQTQEWKCSFYNTVNLSLGENVIDSTVVSHTKCPDFQKDVISLSKTVSGEWEERDDHYALEFVVNVNVEPADENTVVNYTLKDHIEGPVPGQGFSMEIDEGGLSQLNCSPGGPNAELFTCSITGKANVDARYTLKLDKAYADLCDSDHSNILEIVDANGESAADPATALFDCPPKGSSSSSASSAPTIEVRKSLPDTAGWQLSEDKTHYLLNFQVDANVLGDAQGNFTLKDNVETTAMRAYSVEMSQDLTTYNCSPGGGEDQDGEASAVTVFSGCGITGGQNTLRYALKYDVAYLKECQGEQNNVIYAYDERGDEVGKYPLPFECPPFKKWKAFGAVAESSQQGFCCDGYLTCNMPNIDSRDCRGSWSGDKTACQAACQETVCCPVNKETGATGENCSAIDKVGEEGLYGMECAPGSTGESADQCSALVAQNCCPGGSSWVETYSGGYECCPTGNVKSKDGTTMCCPNTSDELVESESGDGTFECQSSKKRLQTTVSIIGDGGQVLARNNVEDFELDLDAQFDATEAIEPEKQYIVKIEHKNLSSEIIQGVKLKINTTNLELQGPSEIALESISPGKTISNEFTVKAVKKKGIAMVVADLKGTGINFLTAQLTNLDPATGRPVETEEGDPAAVVPIGIPRVAIHKTVKSVNGVAVPAGNVPNVLNGDIVEFEVQIGNYSDFAADSLMMYDPGEKRLVKPTDPADQQFETDSGDDPIKYFADFNCEHFPDNSVYCPSETNVEGDQFDSIFYKQEVKLKDGDCTNNIETAAEAYLSGGTEIATGLNDPDVYADMVSNKVLLTPVCPGKPIVKKELVDDKGVLIPPGDDGIYKVRPDKVLRFKITVENPNPIELKFIDVIDTMADLTYVKGSDPSGECSEYEGGKELRCLISTLPPKVGDKNGIHEIFFEAKVGDVCREGVGDDAFIVTNDVELYMDEGDTDLGKAATWKAKRSCGKLEVEKEVAEKKDAYKPGDEVTYKLKINNKTDKALSPQFLDRMPPGVFETVPDKPLPEGCTFKLKQKLGDADFDVLVCDPLKQEIPAEGSIDVQYTLRIKAGIPPEQCGKELPNKIIVGTVAEAAAKFTIAAEAAVNPECVPKLKITKTNTPDCRAGDIRFTILVKNEGGIAVDTTLTDDFKTLEGGKDMNLTDGPACVKVGGGECECGEELFAGGCAIKLEPKTSLSISYSVAVGDFEGSLTNTAKLDGGEVAKAVTAKSTANVTQIRERCNAGNQPDPGACCIMPQQPQGGAQQPALGGQPGIAQQPQGGQGQQQPGGQQGIQPQGGGQAVRGICTPAPQPQQCPNGGIWMPNIIQCNAVCQTAPQQQQQQQPGQAAGEQGGGQAGQAAGGTPSGGGGQPGGGSSGGGSPGSGSGGDPSTGGDPGPDPPDPVCGNGTVEAAEECDDGNKTNNDGCSSVCKIEPCGNGVIDDGEECDNGKKNVDVPLAGRGSSRSGLTPAIPIVQTGTANPYADFICRKDCTLARCGDGIKDANEECDDGNNKSLDGCSKICLIEPSICGDAKVDKDNGEQCDNGSKCVPDPYSSSSSSTSSLSSSSSSLIAQSSSRSSLTNVPLAAQLVGGNRSSAGRAASAGKTECISDDDCRPGTICQYDLEKDKLCSNECLRIVIECGNGKIEDKEECDDGNKVSGDGCTSDCRQEFCGDSTLQAGRGEACDNGSVCRIGTALNDKFNCRKDADCRVCIGVPGTNEKRCGGDAAGLSCTQDSECTGTAYTCEYNVNKDKFCNNLCARIVTVCGNKVEELGEECDDGNSLDGDGCSKTCLKEFCGDAITDTKKGEQCDNGSVCNLNPSQDCRKDADCRKCTRIEGTDVNRCGGDPSAKICGVDADCADIEALKCVYDTEQDKGCSAECKRTNAGLCGNGTTEPGEECDDGNALSGDGCSVACKKEFCGDATIQSCNTSSAPMPGMTMLCEQCDNGSICSQNSALTCLRDEDCRTCREIPNTNPNIPNVLKRCGGDPKSIPCQVDADCVNTTFSCDYNASKDLTCSNLCLRQGGSSSSSSSSLPPFCGDGSKQYNEQCDNGRVCRIDNELKSNFACVNDSDCRVCIAAPGTDLKYCGGDADSYPCTKNSDCTKYEYTCEYNVPKNPLCTPECRLTVCGDGVEEGAEECDDGNSRDQDGCDKTCKDEFCGDAKVQPNLNGEVCDNGSVCSTDPTRTCRRNEDCRVCSKIPGTSVSRCGGDPLGKLCNYNSECSGETAIVCQYNLTKDAKCGPDCKRGGSSSTGSVGSQSSTSSLSSSSTSNPNPSSASSTSNPNPSSASSTSNPSSRSSTSSVSSNTAICGNGIPEPPEECDYGDAGAEDGCSPACMREFCGDGVLQKKLEEMCDNGSVCNQNSTLSCRKDSDCRKCLPARNTNPDLPNVLKRCGGDPYGQACETDAQCDKAPFICQYDLQKNLACDKFCQTSSVPASSRSSVSTSSVSRSSVSSTSSVSSIKTLCGDKIEEGSEECDDGNNADQDGCDKLCRDEFCGDGLLQPNFNNEQCDNGSVCSTDPTKACRNNAECRVCLKIAGTEASRCGGDPRGKLCATNEECKDEAGILCVYNSAKNLLCTNECQSLARSSSSSSRTSQSSTSSSSSSSTSSSSTSSSSSSSSTSSSSSSSSSLRGCVRDVDCNDGNNYCTYDVCVNGVCQYNPIMCPPDLLCDPTRGYCVCPPNLIFCPAQNRCLPPPGDCGTPVGFCGNGLVEPPEQCDDANPFLGDGCRPDCTVEFTIPPGTNPDPPLPPIAVCGDGVLQYPEQCEDGNSRPNDGCSLTCQLERVGTTGGIGSVIGGNIGGVGGIGGQQYRCGDGILVRGEQCDDGNTLSGDGCDVSCRVETPLVRPPLPACGNGRLDKGEECDDGNLFAGDGCGSACFTERGFCGDGLVQQALGEQCEPTVSTYSSLQCGQNCRYLLRFCGNGRVEPGEECDDGNGNSNSPNVLCRPDCRRARCGDSIRDTSEQCDDGNNVSGDSCSFDCRSELLPNFPVVKSPDSGASSTNVSGAGGRPVNTLPNFPLQPRQPGVGTVPPIITALPSNLYTLPLGQQGANAGAGGVQGRIQVQQRQDQQVRQVTNGKPPQGDTGPAALAVMGAGAAAGWAWMRRRRGVS